MTDTYCGKCEDRPESQENVDSESAPSAIGEGIAREESDPTGERGKVETEQDFCKLFCRGEPHLAPCDWQRYLKLGYQAKDRYNLVDGTLLSRVGMVEGDEHTKVICGSGSLLGQVWIDK